MNLKTVFGVVGAAMLLASTSAYSREFADIYTECGLGAMIAPKNEAVAAVTNVTWDLGTTAISSNVSSEDTCSGGKVAAASFITNSYASLEKELARGSGEHVNALFEIMNCSADANAKLVGTLRGEFSGYAGTASYAMDSDYQKSEKLYNIVNKTVSSNPSGVCNLT
ncbi:hypothetical protein MNBD_GAMMA15-203 [hydrothermal vent metagenome]|uniref:DUF3015 domain-containing protein n=1 Tax=hydrothermal vent metagenome TaxID=652676 RepID=A0A3B0YE41_9ZZZZ